MLHTAPASLIGTTISSRIPLLDLLDLPVGRVPRAFADAHDAHEVGTHVRARFSPQVDPAVRRDLVEGGGFVPVSDLGDTPEVVIERARTLPDRVDAELRVILCGLNPSLYAADVGVGFARPGNRFWPAARASGLVTVDRDPRHALDAHRVGMTDLVKRATARADELARAEYVAGAARVARLCELLQPSVLCVVGLTGWRTGVDKRTAVGVQTARIGRTVVYVMPNPSGLNAHVTVADLAEHFRTVAALADAPHAVHR